MGRNIGLSPVVASSRSDVFRFECKILVLREQNTDDKKIEPFSGITSYVGI